MLADASAPAPPRILIPVSFGISETAALGARAVPCQIDHGAGWSYLRIPHSSPGLSSSAPLGFSWVNNISLEEVLLADKKTKVRTIGVVRSIASVIFSDGSRSQPLESFFRVLAGPGGFLLGRSFLSQHQIDVLGGRDASILGRQTVWKPPLESSDLPPRISPIRRGTTDLAVIFPIREPLQPRSRDLSSIPISRSLDPVPEEGRIVITADDEGSIFPRPGSGWNLLDSMRIASLSPTELASISSECQRVSKTGDNPLFWHPKSSSVEVVGSWIPESPGPKFFLLAFKDQSLPVWIHMRIPDSANMMSV